MTHPQNPYPQRVPMLDIHIALCAVAWGVIVLLPPNNLFSTYVALRALGQWGVSEIVSGCMSIAGGAFHLWVVCRHRHRHPHNYILRRLTMTLGSGWWVILFLSGIQTPTTLPSAGVYLVTGVMCGVQAIRAKHTTSNGPVSVAGTAP